MKYTDLTKEQQLRFNAMIDAFGEPVEGATHFHMNGMNRWFMVNNAEVYWWDHRDTKTWWKEYELGGVSRTLGFSVKDLVPIPDKPWYNPKDTALASKPKIRKIVYDRNAFNQAINWILNNSPYAKEDWRWTLPLDVRRWMQDMIRRYDDGEIDGVSYTGSAGLTLMAFWEDEDVLQFELFADVSVGSDSGLYEYDPEDVF